MQHIVLNDQNLIAPKVIQDRNGAVISSITDDFGNKRKVRLLTWISGRVLSSVNPQLDDLRFSLGKQCGLLTRSLQGFEHQRSTSRICLGCCTIFMDKRAYQFIF